MDNFHKFIDTMIDQHPIPYFKAFLISLLVIAGLSRYIVAPITTLELRGDILLFEIWGQSAREHGLLNVYTSPINLEPYGRVALPNYLPPYLYVIWAASYAHQWFAPGELVGTPLASVIFKTPAILADLTILLLLVTIVKRRYGQKWALGIGAIYVFMPFTNIDSIIWGQVDAINGCFMLLCVWMLEKRRFQLATLFFAVALSVKLQSVVLLPLLLFEIIHHGRLRDIWHSFGVGLATMVALFAPFLFTGRAREVFSVFTGSAGQFPYVSANAFNFWWLFSGGHWKAVSDSLHFLGLPLMLWGGIFFSAAVVFALWFRYRLTQAEGLWLSACFLAFAFFMLPTEMHERYIFPWFLLALPLFPLLTRIRWLFVALSLTFTWNLFVVYFILRAERVESLGNFWGGSYVVSLINISLFIATLVWYVQMARRRQIV
jgi:Gpi18-like mannosyltransferase